ncbi:hypothetical protein VTL71DRAFT_11300 [Oculimacula yallundae]|uniref:Uncharacterized protein n=1 Tax=Oculimacula yallundae TaxID=86028 RepID=A0ABR4CQV5_9HELO
MRDIPIINSLMFRQEFIVLRAVTDYYNGYVVLIFGSSPAAQPSPATCFSRLPTSSLRHCACALDNALLNLLFSYPRPDPYLSTPTPPLQDPRRSIPRPAAANLSSRDNTTPHHVHVEGGTPSIATEVYGKDTKERAAAQDGLREIRHLELKDRDGKLQIRATTPNINTRAHPSPTRHSNQEPQRPDETSTRTDLPSTSNSIPRNA